MVAHQAAPKASFLPAVSSGSVQLDLFVAAAPKVYTGQTIFLFPALEPADMGSILQPVLQYGPSFAGGGNYWAITSVLGGKLWSGNYYHSALRKVSTGEVISGLMYYIGSCQDRGCIWGVAMRNSKNTTNLTLNARADTSWRWVFGGAIEVYNINSCSKYPATYDNFYSFEIQDFNNTKHTASWTPNINVHTCGEKVTYNSNMINLYY